MINAKSIDEKIYRGTNDLLSIAIEIASSKKFVDGKISPEKTDGWVSSSNSGKMGPSRGCCFATVC